VVRHYEESVDSWPNDCRGLKVGLLADLHVGSPYNGLPRLAEVVQKTNATKPDLVLLLGDYVIQGVVGGSFISPEAAAEVLSQLTSPMGTYAILGNHDWLLDADRVEKALVTAGIGVLEDDNVQLQHANCRFTLAGVSDYWEGPHDVAKALAGHDSQLPLVVISHNPDVIQDLPSAVDYFFAGHTHGGQVDLPLLGRLIVPSEFGDRYAAGPLVGERLRGFVSSGIGTSIIPVRFRVPPEISIVSLH